MQNQLHISSISIPFSWNSILEGILNEPKLIGVWCFIFICICSTLILLNKSLYSRRKKNSQIAKGKKLNQKYHLFLSELASGNYENKALELMAGEKETTLALNKIDFMEPFHRTTLLNSLLNLHRDLAGEAAHKLREIYLSLGYKEESLKKLKSRSWEKRVAGIKELNQMDIRDGYAPLFRLINDKNPLVKLEAILTRMKMDTSPLSFFNELENDITEWEQLRIHHCLAQFPIDDVPSFTPYLNHHLESVQLFSVRMCAIFNEVGAEQNLLELLNKETSELNLAIVDSLSNIGGEKAIHKMYSIYEHTSSTLKKKIINSLLKISGAEELDFFNQQLQAGDYDIQLAAANALVHLGEKGEQYLTVQAQNSASINRIVEHAKEWRAK